MKYAPVKDSLHALLAGAIDYAGVFPPARLDLAAAAANYAGYRQSSDRWLLGRFCCPAERLADLARLELAEVREFPLTAIAAGAANSDEFMRTMDLADVSGSPLKIECFEARLPDDAQQQPELATVTRLLHALVAGPLAADLSVRHVFLEVPVGDDRAVIDDARALHAAIAAAADYNASAASRQCSAGLKLRTGGTTAAGFPHAGELARALCACRDAHMPWKATAGLHHPLARDCAQLHVRMHGFVSLHVAAILAAVHQLDASTVEQILADEHADSFEFTDELLRWRDLQATSEQVAAARERSLVSFGSCDFAGPGRELRELGWV